jgi:hypothetical protein
MVSLDCELLFFRYFQENVLRSHLLEIQFLLTVNFIACQNILLVSIKSFKVVIYNSIEICLLSWKF